MNEKSAYWIEIAEYDLETARAMLETERFLYVGFMCHQVIEKMLKACYAGAKDEVPPYIHNLKRLAEMGPLHDRMTEEHRDLLDALEPLNIQVRYPAELASLASALNDEVCRDLLSRTGELYGWIKQQLSNM